MCNWVLKNNQEKPFRLFVYLKLFYPNGKINWKNNDIALAALTLCNTERTIKNNFKKLNDFKWVYYDEEYEYSRIKSFEKIREDNSWELRRAYCFRYNDLFKMAMI